MKKLTFLFFVLPAFVGFGQSPVAEASTCNECSDYVFTSVSALKDVAVTDACFVQLQSLVERYGVNIAPCNVSTFGGSQTLTNGALAQIMISSLRIMGELKTAAISEKSNADKIKIEAMVKLNGFDVFMNKYTSISKIKDVKPSDCFYSDVKVLLEDYKVDISNKSGLLQASKPANGTNAAILLKQVFGLTNLDISKFTSPTITKSEFAILLSDALDGYNEKLAAATY